MEQAHDESTAAADGAGVRSVAILVVYFLRKDTDQQLVQLQLDRIARHTSVPYTLYAAANRATATTRGLLAATPNVALCDVPETELRGNREHAHYLDALVQQALDDGASHLVTLDVDSFPVRDDWIQSLTTAAPPASGLAGILRAENGDVALPHPSCTFARRSFFEQYGPSFSPDSDTTPEFRRFLRTTGQAGDTGIRLGYTLWANDLPWGQLLRSNRHDLHYLMAGIYGDLVFHLGAAARAILFRRDLEHSLAHRLSAPLERYPPRSPSVIRTKKWLLGRIRNGAEQRLISQNGEIAAVICNWLLADPEGFIAYLRAEAPRPDLPDWLDRLAAVSPRRPG
ncbi:MAG: hypothetical protein FJW88_08915 [Actinobacteria bacterium]|nr:hypothetical protein [Actinomycetota bacterium]